jgi:NAD(P)-dependent dehydrogenase (short-subunit alcohol dehydrogenase family)
MVINAIGPQPEAAVTEAAWADHLAQLDFFVKSPVLLGRALIPGMRARRNGRVVHAAVSPGPGVLFSGLDDAGSSGRAAHDDAWPEQAASGTGKGGTGEAAEIAALI